MAAANIPDSSVCFAELIVRLDSLLTLRTEPEEQEQQQEQGGQDEPSDKQNEEAKAIEADVKLKLSEIHLRIKNGGAIQDRSLVEHEDDDDEDDEAVEDFHGPASASDSGAALDGSANCVGCSSAEDDEEGAAVGAAAPAEAAQPSPKHTSEHRRKKVNLSFCDPVSLYILGERRTSHLARRTQRLMNQDNVTALLRLSLLVFSRQNFGVDTVALAAQLVAEICKLDEGRKAALRYRNSGGLSVVKGVGQVLTTRDCSLEACVQLCRVIGKCSRRG